MDTMPVAQMSKRGVRVLLVSAVVTCLGPDLLSLLF